MKKFFKNIFSVISYYIYTLILCLVVSIVSSFILAGLASLPFIITNIILNLYNIWNAPWWLYLIEIIMGSIFWIVFVDFVREEPLNDYNDINYPYNDYIEERDE